MRSEEREDCGWSGIDAWVCQAKGCCFDASKGNTIWCFHKKTNESKSILVHLSKVLDSTKWAKIFQTKKSLCQYISKVRPKCRILSPPCSTHYAFNLATRYVVVIMNNDEAKCWNI